MSWTRASSVPTGGGGPRGLRLDREGQSGHGGERAGHDGRDLRHGDQRALPNGSDGQEQGRALLRGEHGGALRQELDVSTDLLDLGTEPNPWWSAGVQREHLQEARQLAMEQPMWTPREEVSVKEDLPEIEDADASRELEPMTMGRMGAPSSWSTRRGVALQTQGAMPSNDDEDLRYPQDAGQGNRLDTINVLDEMDTIEVLDKMDTIKVLDEMDTIKVLDVMDTIQVLCEMDTIKVLSEMDTLKVLNQLGTTEVPQRRYLLEKCNVLAKGVVKEEWCGPMGWEVRYHLMGLQDKVGRLENCEVRYQV